MIEDHAGTRRSFLATLGTAGAVAALGGGALGMSPASAFAGESGLASSRDWDLRWLERVRRARHRAVFDAANRGNVLDLSARYLEGVVAAYPDQANSACAVLNFRTRAVSMGLNDAMWAKYPLAEDYKIDDPDTGKPARRNVDLRLGTKPADNNTISANTIEVVQARGGVVIVCDFAMGHLATRLAQTAGAEKDAVHADLAANLVAGAFLVPAGIFGMAEAQNAGCAFVSA